MQEKVVLRLCKRLTPPKDPQVREDFVRHCMSRFAKNRGYYRLAQIITRGSEDDVKAVLLAISQDGGESRELDVLKAGAHLDATFVRLSELASDTLSWEGEANQEEEYRDYVMPVWNALTDELEYETPDNDDDYLARQYERADFQTKRGAKTVALTDKRKGY